MAKGWGGKVGRVLVHPGLRPTEASLHVSGARAAGRRSKGLSKQRPAHEHPLPCGGIWTFLGESREALEGFLEEERSKPGLRRLRNLCNHSVTLVSHAVALTYSDGNGVRGSGDDTGRT